MEAEKKLKWLRHFDTLVKSKRQEIASLRSSVYRSVNFLDHHGQSETSENLNIKIIDQSEAIARDIEHMYQERDELVQMIEHISDPVSSLVIRLYYLNGYEWNAITREIPGSVRTLQNLRTKALKEIELMIQEKALD